MRAQSRYQPTANTAIDGSPIHITAMSQVSSTNNDDILSKISKLSQERFRDGPSPQSSRPVMVFNKRDKFQQSWNGKAPEIGTGSRNVPGDDSEKEVPALPRRPDDTAGPSYPKRPTRPAKPGALVEAHSKRGPERPQKPRMPDRPVKPSILAASAKLSESSDEPADRPTLPQRPVVSASATKVDIELPVLKARPGPKTDGVEYTGMLNLVSRAPDDTKQKHTAPAHPVSFTELEKRIRQGSQELKSGNEGTKGGDTLQNPYISSTFKRDNKPDKVEKTTLAKPPMKPLKPKALAQDHASHPDGISGVGRSTGAPARPPKPGRPQKPSSKAALSVSPSSDSKSEIPSSETSKTLNSPRLTLSSNTAPKSTKFKTETAVTNDFHAHLSSIMRSQTDPSLNTITRSITKNSTLQRANTLPQAKETKLTHPNKSRAKGPKRKLPKSSKAIQPETSSFKNGSSSHPEYTERDSEGKHDLKHSATANISIQARMAALRQEVENSDLASKSKKSPPPIAKKPLDLKAGGKHNT